MNKVLLSSLFTIKAGDYHAFKELDAGTVPLISCGDEENGLAGYFSIPVENRYSKAITVAFNGRPLTAKYHPYEFGAKDDVAVLIPRFPFTDSTLIFIAAILNMQKWRYSYGRKCFKQKLERLNIEVPLDKKGNIDEKLIREYQTRTVKDYIPTSRVIPFKGNSPFKYVPKSLSEIFRIENGAYHKTEGLDEGATPLISCSDAENGIVGYFEIPKKNTHANALTVSFDGLPLTVKYHNYNFAAYDNVGVLLPLTPLKDSTLLYIAGLISLQQWRYSYGRKCYQSKMEGLMITVPVTKDGLIDEKFIGSLLPSIPFSDVVIA